MKTSGKCTDIEGGDYITDAAKCESAAQSLLGMNNAEVNIVSKQLLEMGQAMGNKYPAGCFEQNQGLNLNNNYDAEETKNSVCSNDDGHCLCLVSAPTCTHTAGKITNTAACHCGPAVLMASEGGGHKLILRRRRAC